MHVLKTQIWCFLCEEPFFCGEQVLLQDWSQSEARTKCKCYKEREKGPRNNTHWKSWRLVIHHCCAVQVLCQKKKKTFQQWVHMFFVLVHHLKNSMLSLFPFVFAKLELGAKAKGTFGQVLQLFVDFKVTGANKQIHVKRHWVLIFVLLLKDNSKTFYHTVLL